MEDHMNTSSAAILDAAFPTAISGIAPDLGHRSIISELSREELEQVQGGFGPKDGFEVGVAVGTVGGAVLTGTLMGASRYGVIGGALGFAGGLGWGIGTYLYKKLH